MSLPATEISRHELERDFDYEGLYRQQEPALQALVRRLFDHSPYYREKLTAAGITPGDIRTAADLEYVPLTDKGELRNGKPLDLMAVPEEKVVRIHSSSGTTGKPIIIPYTAGDVAAWAQMMARCFALAGVTNRDRVQITPGYGLWTAGIGFQAGVEYLGAMAIPTGAGNTEKQLEMMVDLQATVLTATASYALFLGEEIERRGLREKIALRVGLIGSERWGEKMRRRIEELLGIEAFDIYGLTEIYGPGIGLDCPAHEGIHMWTDHLLLEIIDPATGKQLPPGATGELVITTLTKEGMPLLRYRTHDLTCLKAAACSCGSPYPMIERVLGRTDDMVKVKGVNIFPGQVDNVLHLTPGAGSEYQLILTRDQGKDRLLVKMEYLPGHDGSAVAAACRHQIKARIGILADVEAVPQGTLPRSEKKTRRVYDYREN
ncbi:phenylacetate--CoA ligase family protein [Moorella sp. Hama-1]|uniref:phenylacetate--CoA ligase family protein n=1 Tax=Moorella sp. Hama-1 TaxID=2138101 RepID=UPI000D657B83|nr:phenylacetate--CoA ligase [Moorella sp. Hama-1]MDN5361061.1 phenylacetate-CoA ligase [Moorella sp. (in: firmicutes)]BCV20996.1 phenylacetate-coenzyme A ligase [Moorella sp. Hama-1]